MKRRVYDPAKRHAAKAQRREYMRKYNKEWRKKHPQHASEQRAKHREQIRIAQRERYKENPEPRRTSARKWRAKNPNYGREWAVRKAKEIRDKYLQRRFGITCAQYDAMLHQQGGVCPICGCAPKTRRLPVDHDHKTGRVRGAPCHMCNRYRIGNNTVETARKVLAYLESDFDARRIVA